MRLMVNLKTLVLSGGSVDLAPEAGGSGEAGALEVLGNKRSKEVTEEKVTTTGLGKTGPGENEQLGGIPEGDPVGHAEERLKHAKEAKEHPVGNPLGVIGPGAGEKSMHGVVARDNESSKVGEALSSKVEDNEEEVEDSNATDDISLGGPSLLLKVHQDRVLA